MNENIIADLLEPIERRRYRLLKYLLRQRESNYKKIVEDIDITIFTAHSDIYALNFSLDDYINIKIEDDKNIYLSLKSKNSKEIEKEYLKESKNLQILFSLFDKHNTSNLLSITDHLHISLSSGYLYLRNISKILKKYDISITKKFNNFEGNENNIRILQYLINTIFKENYITDDFNSFFNLFENEGIIFIPDDKLNIQNLLTIVMNRTYNNNYIEVEDNIKDLISNCKIYLKTKNIIYNIFKRRNIKLTDDEIIYIFIFVTKNFNFSFKDFDDVFLFNNVDNLVKFEHSLDDLVKNIDKSLGLNVYNNKEYFNMIREILIKRYINFKYIPIKYSLYKNTLDSLNFKENDYFVCDCENTYNIIENYIKKWAVKHNYNNILDKDIEDFYLLIESFRINSYKQNCKILIYLVRGKEWEIYVRNRLNGFVHSAASITLYSDIAPANDFNYDFIITDTRLDLCSDKKIVYLNNPLEIEDMKDLHF